MCWFILTIPILRCSLGTQPLLPYLTQFLPSHYYDERPKSPRKSLNMQLKEILGYCALL